MKTVECGGRNVSSDRHNNKTEIVVDKKSPQQNQQESGQLLTRCPEQLLNKPYRFLNKFTKMGHKGHYQKVLLTNNVTSDSRSQSLPDCCNNDDKIELNIGAQQQQNDNCNNQKELESPNNTQSPPQTPTEQWFNTWPERYEKLKSSDNSPELDHHSTKSQYQNTPNKFKHCDNLTNGNVKNKLTFNEALQNISLAYSPVTKQLHLVDKSICSTVKDDNNCNNSVNLDSKKKTHKRTEAGSFSSTVSSLSDLSPSGSLLDSDERSLTSFEDYNTQTRRRSLTNFFSKNYFSWKSGSKNSNVWSLFSRSKNNPNSPHHVASSTALIQHARPSNLPAKTQEEEQRHREEHQAIIAAAKKKEAQNNAARQRLHRLQLEQEEHQANATKHFSSLVLPNWEAMRSNKKTRDLWWQGLPSSVRGKVWRLAIGNELNLTSQLYEICLNRAQNRLNSPQTCRLDDDQESSMDAIQLDISRTFPNLCIFQEGGPYSDILHSLLAAYVCYRPDVGYVQGMSYIAAILILNMEAFDAFICFANLLNQPLHLSAFTLNQEQMNAYYDAYNEVFCYNLPKLYAHFENSKLTPDLYLLDWIYTIFAKAMPLDVACRVWDIFLRDGFEFIFRTAIGILHLNQDTLLAMDFLHGAQFLTRLPDDLSADQLFKSIQAVTTSIGKHTFCQIVDKYSFSTR